MNIYTVFEYGKFKYKPNTFIGGVGTTLNTPALIAPKLGITTARIKSFSVIGNDIQFAVVGGNYSIVFQAFVNNANITYYHDLDGLCTVLGAQCFYNATSLREVKLKNVTSLGQYIFNNTALSGNDNDLSSVTTLGDASLANIRPVNPLTLSLPSLTTISNSFAITHNNETYSNLVTFLFPISFMTVNSGKPHAYLVANNIKATNIEYIGYTNDNTYNTAIGGYQNTYINKGLLANFLTIGSGAFVNFQNDVNDVRFKMLTTYTPKSYTSNTTITYYHDLDGLVTTLPSQCFYNASNLTNVKLKSVTTLSQFTFRATKLSGTDNDFTSVTTTGDSTFGNLTSNPGTILTFPNLVNIPNVNAFGASPVSNNITIEVPDALRTANSGKPISGLVATNLGALIVEYIGYVDDGSFNTSIGNYGTIYANKGLLAQANGIGSGAIVNFQNDAGNLKFKALVNYTPKSYNGDTVITHYKDLGGLNLTIVGSGFRSTSNMLEIILAGCTNLGGSVGDNSVFNNIKTGATITVPIALQTANAGAPDGDLVYASGTRGATIIYI